jgi:hypothetical protein
MGNRRRRGSVPGAYGETRLFAAKIWNPSDEAHHEVFLTRLFHAATRRDKGQVIKGA